MKNTKMRLLIIFISSLLFGACQNVLEENPKNFYQGDNLTEGSANAAIKGVYEPLTRSRGRLWESRMFADLEAMSDYGVGTLAFFEATQYNNTASDFASRQTIYWQSLYQSIGRANSLLSSLKKSDLNPDFKIKLEAECRFVRSFAYYYLVRLWGKVPLRLNPVVTDADYPEPLAEIETIYEKIKEDVGFAAEKLPDSYSANNLGRGTSGAAKVLLADVYLTLKDFAKAREISKDIMDNKARWGYDLYKAGLAALYSPTEQTNIEDVWSLKFIRLPGYGSFIPTYIHDSKAGYSNRGLTFIEVNRSWQFNSWDNKDLRKSWNIYSMVNDKPVEADLSNSKTYFRKFRDSEAPEETASGNDFYLYRYADVLLIFAEAENKINGPTAEAYEAINKVRRRAYGADINSLNIEADLPIGLSQEAFDNLVFRERGYEFMLETKRWFDMKRTGRVKSSLTEAGKGNFYNESADYWFIPQSEIDGNPALSK